MDPFLHQLARLAVEQPTRAKWVFVPAHAIGRTLAERIALAGTSCLNLRFVTPLDVALRMGAPFLVERGVDPSEEGLGPALMMRLLLDLPAEGGYFRPLASHPTMAQALWSTIRELRMAGLAAVDLQASAFESPAKYTELKELLAAYERFLEKTDRGDVAAVYGEAMTHPDWCPIQAQDCWTEMPDVVWAPLPRRLIDAMPGEYIEPVALAIPGGSLPRRIFQGGTRRERDARIARLTPDSAKYPLAFVLAPKAGRPVPNAPDPPVRLFHAGGREAEVEEVFRRILAAAAPLDEVEIAAASEAHISLIWEKALRHEWPVALGSGIPAASTRPGRALLGLCDWIETDFAAAHLRRLLQSGDMGLDLEDEGFTAGQAARTLALAQAGWGHSTYALAFGGLIKRYHVRADDPDVSNDDREAARAKKVLASAIARWIAKVIASVPEPDATGRVPLQQIVAASLEYLARSTARVSQLDYRAAAALNDHVNELRALGAFACTLTEALRFIRERVQSLRVAPERPRPGSLYVCSLSQIGLSGRPHLFVVGLEEGGVFPSTTEDAVLLDTERAVISPALRLSTDKIDEAVYGLLSRLAARGAGSVTFSYSVRDTREFRETYASWLMLQAFRLCKGDETLSYQQMKAALGEPASAVPPDRARASTASEWWLKSVAGTGSSGVAAVDGTFSSLSRGRFAQDERASDRFTEFDGDVPEAGSVLDPCGARSVFSVTELESSATCPYRLFLKRGLGLRPLDDRERDKDVWLDPLTRGSELHDIYAATLRRCRQESRRPDRKQDGPWLRTLARDRLTTLRRQVPPATEEIFERESREFLADVDLFLDGECSGNPSEPIAFEVSFGRHSPDDGEALARSEPIQIDLGGGLTFRIAGRIDRIDKVGSSSFEIIDYKTGGYWRGDWTGTFDGGRRLQHALYGLAAVEMLRSRYKSPKVAAGVYYFSSHRGGQERLRIPTPDKQDLAVVLDDLRQVIVNGTFVHTPTQDDCKFCDFKAACTSDVNAQAEAKRADAKLRAFERLTKHA